MNYDDYKNDFSEVSFLDKVKNVFSKAGAGVIYASMILFYVLKEESTPIYIKGIIIGALGYFICPIDVIADVIPVLGFSDDLGAVVMALKTASTYVTDDIKMKARGKVLELFKNAKESDFETINQHL